MRIKPRHVVLTGVVGTLAAVALIGSPSKHIGPDYLYPDARFTPGKADTLLLSDLTATYTTGCPNGTVLCTYSQAHRNVSQAEKDQVCQNYPNNCKVKNEKDHFMPLCGGGSNEIANIWAQPETNIWNGQDYGFHAKDKLEAYVCAQIKAGKINPKEAFQRMTGDWVKYYQDLGLNKTFGVPLEVVE